MPSEVGSEVSSRVLVENGPDQGALWHSGSFVQEQRALHEGRGWADLGHRQIITVSGVDRLSWLHSLTTQDLEKLAPHQWTQALILSPHGHVEHHLVVVDDGTTTWIHVEPNTSEELVKYLDSMKFMLRVDVADVSSAYKCIRVPGLPDLIGGPFRIVARNETLVFAADAFEVGTWAIEAERIAAGRPRLKFETDHKTIPNEVGWLNTAVHMNKGCYRGQETVARTFNLGKPPRRLVQLHLDGSVVSLPPHCTPVMYQEKQVGFIGSSALHYELGPIALAVIKRNIPGDALLLAGDIPAAQELNLS
jgi:folate-binding protein YgfZ